MEKVKFKNNRGLKLVGNFWSADSEKGIVMAHGFPHDKNEYGYFVRVGEALNKAGYNVLAFDFSGVGESDKSSITAEKEIEDLDAAIDYIQSRGVEQVGLYGHSLGGYISLKNYRPEVEAIVLTAPVTDSIDTAKNNFIWTFLVKPISRIPSINYLIKKGKLMWIDSKIVEELKAIDQDKILSKVECPVLIIHGSEDEVVSLEDSKNAVEKLETGELQIIEGLTHEYDYHLGKVIKETEAWFDDHIEVT